jgi:predicted small secreted protein
MKILILPLILLVSFMTAGCDLNFGDDVELSGAAFDSAKLAEISALTGVTFPPGAVGIEYYYLGSGIDDALAAKVMIPDEEVDEFKSNTVMTTETDSKASIQIGRGKPWWKIDELTDRIDRKLDLPSARFLEITCGREGSDFVVYLSWITT